MPHYLVEIHMAAAGQLDLERATRMLDAAQSRLGSTGATTRTIVAGFSSQDGRLFCVIEAPDPDAARRLFAVALLPSGRIREITLVGGDFLLSGGHPGSDVDPGFEAELVEDVVDVGFDGSL